LSSWADDIDAAARAHASATTIRVIATSSLDRRQTRARKQLGIDGSGTLPGFGARGSIGPARHLQQTGLEGVEMTSAIGSRGFLLALVAVAVLVWAPGCAVVEGIFKAGVWVGVMVAVIVIGLVLFLVSRLSG
jgi:hypothetical protein